ncbi:MAG: hypothetical protein GXO49_04680 [Chlorobi bacterium]|nr:hypothetical protein [Chlorobiota bacterium]
MTHHFNVELATKLGLEKAIILQNISYWIEKNKANNTNIHDGKVWTYNSYEAFEKLFPYMKLNTIKRIIRELEKDDFLVSRNDLNENPYDKTKWYSFGNNPLLKILLSNVKKITIDDSENNHVYNDTDIKHTDIKHKEINKEKKLKVKKSWDNLSKEMQEYIKSEIKKIEKPDILSLEEFILSLQAKGYKYKDFVATYRVWLKKEMKKKGLTDTENENLEKINFDILLKYINEKTGRKFPVITDAVKKQYYQRLKEGYSKENIFNAINNAIEDDFHKENGYKFLTPEYFSTTKALDMFGHKIKKPKSEQEKIKETLKRGGHVNW